LLDPFVRCYGLVQRGGPGLACDDNGLALGPIALAKTVRRRLEVPPDLRDVAMHRHVGDGTRRARETVMNSLLMSAPRIAASAAISS